SFPCFELKSVVSTDLQTAFQMISNKDYKGKWLIVFFWPKDFSFVCPTEIVEFGQLNKEFNDRGAQVLGGSIDGEYVHLAWRNQHPGLKELPYPMFSDVKRELSQQLGILDSREG